jgi:1,4-dihydroxy-2-naphthoate polyprenyltransferase
LPDAPPRRGKTFLRATRARTLPVALSPVAIGAALAYRRGASFEWGWFIIALAGAVALRLGANVLHDYADERSGADKLARIDRASIATGSGAVASGAIPAAGLRMLGNMLLVVALATGLVLGISRNWIAFGLFGTGASLTWQSIASPLRYAFRGFGELGEFVVGGMVPLLVSYDVIAGRLEGAAWWATIVPGAMTALVALHDGLLHWRADKGAGKITIASARGPETALISSGVLITITYVILAVQVAIGLFPRWALIGLVTAVPLAGSWSRAFRDPLPQHCLNLLGATLGATVLTGAAIALSLIAAR